MEDIRDERIAKAEEGLAEMQEVLDQAKRAVDAADRAERVRRSTGASRTLHTWAWQSSCCSSEQAPSFSRPTLRSNGSGAASNVF
jgi:hypothetical protein